MHNWGRNIYVNPAISEKKSFMPICIVKGLVFSLLNENVGVFFPCVDGCFSSFL
uniref:Uncharacterized protein n=1 Tax=Arundo donax TaxID=35708 RepID=A0A0A9BJK4_ARUDO